MVCGFLPGEKFGLQVVSSFPGMMEDNNEIPEGAKLFLFTPEQKRISMGPFIDSIAVRLKCELPHLPSGHRSQCLVEGLLLANFRDQIFRGDFSGVVKATIVMLESVHPFFNVDGEFSDNRLNIFVDVDIRAC